MARPKPDPQAVVPQIIEAAISMLKKQGFEQLTMKALAQQCGMSVGKLYHFFPSKDDLFLTLEIEYFEGLYLSLDKAASLHREPRDAFRALLASYYAYATEYYVLYKLVSMPPKVYTHYLGTKREALARQELKAALAVVNLVRRHFQALKSSVDAKIDDLDQEFLFCINAMHGLILMSQSAAWPYVSQRLDSERDIPAQAAPADECVQAQLDMILSKLI